MASSAVKLPKIDTKYTQRRHTYGSEADLKPTKWTPSTRRRKKEHFKNHLRPVTCSASTAALPNGDMHHELPELSIGNMSITYVDRYFGENSKELFFETYRQLKGRGELLLGGFQELENVVQQTAENNIFNQSISSLEMTGVLTPMHSNKHHAQASSETEIDSLYNEDDDSFTNFVTYHRSSNPHNEKVRPYDVNNDFSSGIADIDNKILDEDDDDLFDNHSLFSIDSANSLGTLNSTQTYTPNSPRAIFITGCLKKGIPPVTSALIRNKISSKINLSHMHLGDEIAEILSRCIAHLPRLESLNLSGNSFSDNGLTPLIEAIALRSDIHTLNLSKNKVDLRSSGALQRYVGTNRCKLKTLIMVRTKFCCCHCCC